MSLTYWRSLVFTNVSLGTPVSFTNNLTTIRILLITALGVHKREPQCRRQGKGAFESIVHQGPKQIQCTNLVGKGEQIWDAQKVIWIWAITGVLVNDVLKNICFANFKLVSDRSALPSISVHIYKSWFPVKNGWPSTMLVGNMILLNSNIEYICVYGVWHDI